MSVVDQKATVVLGLMEDAHLPLPDEVEYGAGCVRFLWLDRKVAVVIDLEDAYWKDS